MLLAVEVGSRTYGFAHEHSDYDIRFIYIRPRDWYLRLGAGSDVIEWKCESDVGTCDFCGWDVRKVLLLARKSNPCLFEWLSSPIVYRRDAASMDMVERAAFACRSRKAVHFHYYSMTSISRKKYLHDAESEIAPKKYLHALRTLMAMQVSDRTGDVPPIRFVDLLAHNTLPDDIQAHARSLLDARLRHEDTPIAHIRRIDEYLDAALETAKDFVVDNDIVVPAIDLDSVFLALLGGNGEHETVVRQATPLAGTIESGRDETDEKE